MRGARTAAATLMLLASGTAAQYYVEADLDGVVGEPQPDFIVTSVGDTFPVDLWIFGPPASGCWVWGLFLCEWTQSLSWEGATYYFPDGWFSCPTGWEDCPDLCAQFSSLSVPMMFPFRVATVRYGAAVDQAVAELTLGEGSGIIDLSMVTQSFANNGEVLARIQIGDVTEAEATSWGSIKTLFR